MGIMLQRSKIAEDLLITMAQLFGPVPGGLGISVILVGALLAATTGIVGATVIAMGLISLPAMLRNNYSKPLATGTICASGTLGQIIPPSVVLIILADQLTGATDQASTLRKAAYKNVTGEFNIPSVLDVTSTSAGEMFIGALVPGLILVGLYIIYILLDDVGFGEIGMDNLSVIRGYKTPNMSALAEEGLSLNRMYTEPSCTPTRVAMMTGRYPTRTGLTEAKATMAGDGLAAEEVTLAAFVETRVSFEPIGMQHLVVTELGGAGDLRFERVLHKLLRALPRDDHFAARVGGDVDLGGLGFEREMRVGHRHRLPTAGIAMGAQLLQLRLIQFDGVRVDFLGRRILAGGSTFRHATTSHQKRKKHKAKMTASQAADLGLVCPMWPRSSN
jgi:hypothetical protein